MNEEFFNQQEVDDVLTEAAEQSERLSGLIEWIKVDSERKIRNALIERRS